MPEVAIQPVSYTGRRPQFASELVAAFQSNGVTYAGSQILASHVAVSTGWGKSVDNYRIAGMKADASWRASKPYTYVSGCECVAGKPNVSDPACQCESGKGQSYSKSYWRAYNSLSESAADFVGVLRGTRYAAAFALAQNGDTEYFAAVGRAGWYTADPAKMKQYGESALAELQGYLGSAPTSSTDILPLIVAAAIAYYWFTA
jgi:hypothetical protein